MDDRHFPGPGLCSKCNPGKVILLHLQVTELGHPLPLGLGGNTDFSDVDFYQIDAMFGCLIIIARQCPVAPRGMMIPSQLLFFFFFSLLGIVGGKMGLARA